MKYTPHEYQQHAYQHLLEHPGAGLFMEMGLGKTVVALTAADHFLNDACQVTRVLVIGPKKVVQSVWRQEAAKWDHTRHLRFSSILGTESQRLQALYSKADIYLINRENVPWLVSLCAGKFRFDMVIVDESSSFKNSDSKRFRALKSVLGALKRQIILTGTPMPQNFLDLWPQVFILDRGLRLGDSFTRFKNTYFEKDPWRQFTFNLKATTDTGKKDNWAEKEVSEKIGDICISLSEKDYLQLPERIDRYVEIELTPDQKKGYDDFEKSQVLGLPGDQEITAVNAAALTNKLLQYANGAVYDEDKDYHVVHDEKLDRLEEIIDTAAGHPVLIFYTYVHDLQRIKQRLVNINCRELNTDKDVTDWNDRKIPVLLAHPLSAGHGLNLQAGGNIIVWFGLNWALELYQQGNKRIHRQGVIGAVIIHHLLVKGTMDYDVLRVLQSKASNQEALMQAVKARIEKYRKK